MSVDPYIQQLAGGLDTLRRQFEDHSKEDQTKFTQHALDMVELRADVKTLLKVQDGISGGISKLTWIIIGAVVLAAAQWVLRGGLQP